jgi:uncharacterized RDD family membrane protein YckC
VFTVRVNLLPAPVAARAVEIELRPARLPSRALALLLDILLMIVPGSVIVSLVRQVSVHSDDALGQAAQTVGIALIFVGYPVLSEIRMQGRSLGKRALGLRVIREDGGPLRARHAFTRALVGLAVEFPGLLLLFLCWPAGIITMLASAQGRRLGDLAAGTVVVHEREPTPWRVTPPMPHQLAPWAATLDLTAVDDDLAMEIRQFVTRVTDLREPYRERLLVQLSTEVTAKITPPPPPDLPRWTLLITVLAERRRRQETQLILGRMVTDQVLLKFGDRHRHRR